MFIFYEFRRFLYRKRARYLPKNTVYIYIYIYIYLRKKIVKCYNWSVAVCVWCWNLDSSESNQKYLERVEMRCCRRMEKIIWTDRVRNWEVLHRVKEERRILHTLNGRKANWIGHILRRNCLLKQVIEGRIEGRIDVTGRRGRRHKQLLDDLKERREY